MGVWHFYRWLVSKYPKIIVQAIDRPKRTLVSNHHHLLEEDEEDASLANPNGIEFDNLYLDMNGIIHTCFNPQGHTHHFVELPITKPTTFQHVFQNLCDYIDELFQIVRPRKLLFMAIDGVAPRAKLHRQRAGRFQKAKNEEFSEIVEERLRKEFEMEGRQLNPKQETTQVSDANIINPGTEFMHQLSMALRSYINDKLKNDSGWKDINVILSDAGIPGEGEHKIISFIRSQRACPDYNPNTRHCIYGLDTDLIMLALTTHEVHFSILRETLEEPQQRQIQPFSTEKMLTKSENSWLSTRPWFKQLQENQRLSSVAKPYQFLHIWILREYLELEFGSIDTPDKIKMDFERYIDDFVFICLFAGNDFLPHLPTLEIREGAIDLLLHVYKNEFKNFGGFLTDMHLVQEENACYLEMKRIEEFILSIGGYEDKIFKKRSELRERVIKRVLAERSNAKNGQEEEVGLQYRSVHFASANGKSLASCNLGSKTNGDIASQKICDASGEDVTQNMKELKEKLQGCVREKSDQFKNGNFMVDMVRLGTTGYRERYYKENFSSETEEDIENTRKSVVQKYTEGLCWVFEYYYSGVPSWTWFYPYYYGPFASELKGLSQVKVKFQKGLPFKPLDQLMAVLPPTSAHALPKAYRELMTDGKRSKIIDFYPTDFKVDADGKRFLWEAIVKLPFINEERLLTETRKVEVKLTESEGMRNTNNADYLFVKGSNKYEIYHLPDDLPIVPLRPLKGTTFPDKILTKDDISEDELWHEKQGRKPSSNRYKIEARIPGFNSGGGKANTSMTASNCTSTSPSNSSNWSYGKSTVVGTNERFPMQPSLARGGGRWVSNGVQSSRWDDRKQTKGDIIQRSNCFVGLQSFSSCSKRQHVGYPSMLEPDIRTRNKW